MLACPQIHLSLIKLPQTNRAVNIPAAPAAGNTIHRAWEEQWAAGSPRLIFGPGPLSSLTQPCASAASS